MTNNICAGGRKGGTRTAMLQTVCKDLLQLFQIRTEERGDRLSGGVAFQWSRCAHSPSRVPNKRPTGEPFFVVSIPHKVGYEVPVRRAAMCPLAHTGLAAQPDTQNITQLAPRSSTEERPRKVNTYIRLSFETQLEHLRPLTSFCQHT